MSQPQTIPSEARFAMVTCAHGAESAVKQSLAPERWRLAFSRPGFVTLKRDGGDAEDGADLPSGVFVRTAAHSLGSCRDADADRLIDAMLTAARETPFEHIHVWPRDRLPIGKFDFEPGIDLVCQAVAERLVTRITQPADWTASDRSSGDNEAALPWDRLPIGSSVPVNQIAQKGQRVLDLVLIDPSHWFFGWHTVDSITSAWPGGIQPIDPVYPPISRAYFKAAEAIAWSGFEMLPADVAVEVGSAPGGACGRLLELGLQVIAIDPAPMDPRIAGHPKLKHHAARAGDLPRKHYRGAKWLLVDSNVRPEATLSTVKNIVTHRQCHFRGLLITMKLGTYERAREIDAWVATIRSWPRVTDIRVRQLARNRCEVCFAVTMVP
ncbi:MAG: SAM-dependent methyltransferase [Planctomycetota bacterium]